MEGDLRQPHRRANSVEGRGKPHSFKYSCVSPTGNWPSLKNLETGTVGGSVCWTAAPPFFFFLLLFFFSVGGEVRVQGQPPEVVSDEERGKVDDSLFFLSVRGVAIIFQSACHS